MVVHSFKKLHCSLERAASSKPSVINIIKDYPVRSPQANETKDHGNRESKATDPTDSVVVT